MVPTPLATRDTGRSILAEWTDSIHSSIATSHTSPRSGHTYHAMDERKEGVPPAYFNDVPDIHDEKPTGKVVQEEAVHSVALAEAFQASKPSLWSKSMMKLYFIMGKNTAQNARIGFV